MATGKKVEDECARRLGSQKMEALRETLQELLTRVEFPDNDQLS